MTSKLSNSASLLLALVGVTLLVNVVGAVITVQIGGATRLNSLTRQRDRYRCFWDCDLVGCQIAHDDDECAYECEKICRVRYDYDARSGVSDLKPKSESESPVDSLSGKSATNGDQPATADSGINELPNELFGAGTSVRLHLPRNASARNFAIWERCSSDSSTGKLTEKPFNL